MKKVFGILGVLILILGGAAVYIYSMATSNDIGEDIIGKSVLKEDEARGIIENLKTKDDEPLVLTSEELNAITNEISNELSGNESINIQSINTKIEGDKIYVQIPTVVNGKEVILSATTEVRVEDEKLKIEIEQLKSGKLELPEEFIAEQIQSTLGIEEIEVNGSEISIDLDKIPYDIKKLYIEDNKIIINK